MLLTNDDNRQKALYCTNLHRVCKTSVDLTHVDIWPDNNNQVYCTLLQACKCNLSLSIFAGWE